MDSNRWEQVKDVFEAAQRLGPSKRAEYLDQQCANNPAMRAELESLLAHAETVGSFMHQPAIGDALRPLLQALSTQSTDSLTQTMPPAALLLKERYRIEKVLGRGGLGVVYLARDQTLHDKPVVIKAPLNRKLQESWVTQKFAQEIRALAIIDHPGVVGVLDTGLLPDGTPYFVMQYVEGKPLQGLIVPGGMPFPQVAELIGQIGQALAAAHEKNVWHRDLKPSNIMVQTSPEGELHARLIDFGLATVAEAGSQEHQTHVAGSVPYMAPEQLEGRVSRATDIFAFGVVAYEMLTGQKPFRASNVIELRRQQQSSEFVRPRQLRPELSPEAERLLIQALSSNPEKRPASAGQFSQELVRALENAPTEAAKTTRRSMIVAGGGVLLAIAGASTWVVRERRAHQTTVSYSLMVQRDSPAGGRPELWRVGSPLHPSDGFLLLIRSSQPGHLYMLSDDRGAGTINTLFPSPSSYRGESQIASGQSLQVPEHGWFRLDSQPSAQDLWLIWSAEPVPQLEALIKWINPRDRGTIRDPAQISGARAFADQGGHVLARTPPGETGESITGGHQLAWRIHLEGRP